MLVVPPPSWGLKENRLRKSLGASQTLIFYGFFFSSCYQVLAKTSLSVRLLPGNVNKINHFLHRLPLVMVFYHSDTHLTKTQIQYTLKLLPFPNQTAKGRGGDSDYLWLRTVSCFVPTADKPTDSPQINLNLGNKNNKEVLKQF